MNKFAYSFAGLVLAVHKLDALREKVAPMLRTFEETLPPGVM